jgi:hypothetical protein
MIAVPHRLLPASRRHTGNHIRDALRRQSAGSGVVRLAIATDIVNSVNERIIAERDPQQLHRWIGRAANCATTAEVLADD